MPDNDLIKIEGQFDPTDRRDWARYWNKEFAASRKGMSGNWTGIESWQERGERIVAKYRASTKGTKKPNDLRFNIFPANIQTQRAILMGQTPKCTVSRRFEDAPDDDARVAADILERLLNGGLEDDSHGFARALTLCIEDRLIPGMCGAKVDFSADIEPVPPEPAIMGPCPACQGSGSVAAPPMPMPPMGDAGMGVDPAMGMGGEPQPCPQCQGSGQIERAPAKPAGERTTNEQADVHYWNWRDQLWSVARTFEEVRWWAFGAEMSRKQLVEMFGEEDGRKIPVSNNRKSGGVAKDARKETPWSRAMVWEIWSKDHRRVFHLAEGYPLILFPQDNPEGQDPLELEDFWPFAPPMIANATTDAYLPTADYEYAKDLYDEADELTARIRNIVRAIKVVGAYDKASASLKRILDEACELEMIPVKNFSEFLAKGGLKATMDLLPIVDMVNTVQSLTQQRNQVLQDIYQITGLGDIIRGQQNQQETATTSAIKARYASVRLQEMQKEVARYATDLQRVRKEVIAKHWSIETIIERSAILQSEEGQSDEGKERIVRAAQLIKDRHLDFRVVIKPEQISLQDWAQLKQQRSEVLTALGGFFQSSMPMIQLASQTPGGGLAAAKFALGAAQWLVAGMPGASGLESQFDTFISQLEKAAQQAAQQPPQPPPPDPKVQAATVKAKGDVMKTQAATQGRLVEIAAETKATMQQREHDAAMDVATDQAKSAQKMRLDTLKQVQAVIPGGGVL